jgi:hypothetical protein
MVKNSDATLSYSIRQLSTGCSTMPNHSISEAAKIVGKHRSTIQKHIREGKLSRLIDYEGNPYIETSELLRVYKDLIRGVGNSSRVHVEKQQLSTGGSTHKITELEARLESEKGKREKAEALLHKAEEGEASWKEIADRLTFLLTDQSQKQPSKTNVQYEKFMRKITR